MAVILGDSGSVILEFTDEKLAPSIERVTKTSAGGSKRQQVAGERFKLQCKARVTPALFRSTLDLLQDRSEVYFYTPEETYLLYSNLATPIPSMISNIGEEWDNRKVHYITFDVESIDYI